MSKKISPVFRLQQGAHFGVWSVSDNSFDATLLGIVVASVSYPDNVDFTVDEEKLARLEKREIFEFPDLNLDGDEWALDYREGLQPSDLLEQFCREHPAEWNRIEKVSDWLLSLPVREFKQTGLSSDLWE